MKPPASEGRTREDTAYKVGARNSPLTPATFFVLTALTDGENHGYAILKEVARCTNRNNHLGPATLYGTLKRLCVSKMIQISERPRSRLANKQRKYYRLTELGRRTLIAEVMRIEKIVELARTSHLISSDNDG